MAFSRGLNPDEIASILENEDDFSSHDTKSEEEDCVTQDDIRSDIKEEMVDYEEITIQTTRQEDPKSPISSPESPNLEETPSTTRRIIKLPQQSIRGKNNHKMTITS